MPIGDKMTTYCRDMNLVCSSLNNRDNLVVAREAVLWFTVLLQFYVHVTASPVTTTSRFTGYDTNI